MYVPVFGEQRWGFINDILTDYPKDLNLPFTENQFMFGYTTELNNKQLKYLPIFVFTREKEGDLTQSYDKTPYTNRKFENQRTTHTNATKNFDYTTIADRLRTVSWSNK